MLPFHALTNLKPINTMKLFSITATLVALLLPALLFAQAPFKFNYQGVARDASGNLLANQAIGLRISIISGSPTGTDQLIETHAPTTNDFGLFNIEIGGGTIVLVNPAFDLGTDAHFVKVEMDATGGINYIEMGTSQLLSVPYALYAAESGTGGAPGPTGPAGPSGADGTNGATGATGPSGTNGTNGSVGATGSTGATGATGPSGANGTNGSNGIGGVTTAGAGISITGTGTVGNPYTVSVTGCNLSIGDTHQGGIIFYLDGTGCHGLVAKATDETVSYQWSSTNFSVWAWAAGIYGGAQNTKKSIAFAASFINSSTCPAASIASQSFGGYGDWYLPSKDELDMMYVNLYLQGIGSFTGFNYWSSTENDFSSAWKQGFGNGGQNTNSKNIANYVRAIRSF